IVSLLCRLLRSREPNQSFFFPQIALFYAVPCLITWHQFVALPISCLLTYCPRWSHYARLRGITTPNQSVLCNRQCTLRPYGRGGACVCSGFIAKDMCDLLSDQVCKLLDHQIELKLSCGAYRKKVS